VPREQLEHTHARRGRELCHARDQQAIDGGLGLREPAFAALERTIVEGEAPLHGMAEPCGRRGTACVQRHPLQRAVCDQLLAGGIGRAILDVGAVQHRHRTALLSECERDLARARERRQQGRAQGEPGPLDAGLEHRAVAHVDHIVRALATIAELACPACHAKRKARAPAIVERCGRRLKRHVQVGGRAGLDQRLAQEALLERGLCLGARVHQRTAAAAHGVCTGQLHALARRLEHAHHAAAQQAPGLSVERHEHTFARERTTGKHEPARGLHHGIAALDHVAHAPFEALTFTS
jgi:hypothetical protein